MNYILISAGSDSKMNSSKCVFLYDFIIMTAHKNTWDGDPPFAVHQQDLFKMKSSTIIIVN